MKLDREETGGHLKKDNCFGTRWDFLKKRWACNDCNLKYFAKEQDFTLLIFNN